MAEVVRGGCGPYDTMATLPSPAILMGATDCIVTCQQHARFEVTVPACRTSCALSHCPAATRAPRLYAKSPQYEYHVPSGSITTPRSASPPAAVRFAWQAAARHATVLRMRRLTRARAAALAPHGAAGRRASLDAHPRCALCEVAGAVEARRRTRWEGARQGARQGAGGAPQEGRGNTGDGGEVWAARWAATAARRTATAATAVVTAMAD
eukprot:3131020-Prymnesium_polylepis.1